MRDSFFMGDLYPDSPLEEIYFLRHIKSKANEEEEFYVKMADHAIPASENGLTVQGPALVKFLDKQFADTPNDSILMMYSPYVRVVQMMELVDARLDKKVKRRIQHPLMGEIQWGAFPGTFKQKHWDNWAKKYPHYLRHMITLFKSGFGWYSRPPGGESKLDVCQRMYMVLDTLFKMAKILGCKKAILGCHDVTLRVLLATLFFHPVEYVKDSLEKPGNAWVRLVKNGKDEGYIYRPEWPKEIITERPPNKNFLRRFAAKLARSLPEQETSKF